MHADTELPQTAERPPLDQQRRLLPTLRDALRLRRYSLKTEKAYLHWVKRFVRFHRMRHPKDMGAKEVTAFLNHLAGERQVAAATQNQALAALLFLYRQVLGIELPWLDDLVRAKTSKRLPTVLTRDEVQAILAQLSGTRWLLVSLLYGAGLRLNECLSLRVKDLDLAGSKLIVRQGKGNKDRVTLLPRSLMTPLAAHLEQVKAMHSADLARGQGEAPMPLALAGKYPKAGYLWAWQFVFPSSQHCRDPYTGRTVRFHVHEKTLQRTVKEAARCSAIGKPVGCHTFRHAFATHLLESGHNIRVVQELMGHKDVATTMIYTHVMNNSLAAVRSPADVLPG
ncbi:MAG: integron integrase [Sideroxyarcus sp.]|nr:integron integrase [Sideroxyarcus sp.]